jgi:hypothetical protein
LKLPIHAAIVIAARITLHRDRTLCLKWPIHAEIVIAAQITVHRDRTLALAIFR